jgi:hypothetical protein
MMKSLTTFGIALIACTAGLQANATSAESAARWQFDVSLDGKSIGFHSFDLQQEGAQTVLTSEASFDVKFLFVTAFKYRHQNTEVWRDDCLLSINASTSSNGKKQVVRGTATEESFSVQGTAGSDVLPSCVQTFAYWNPSMLESNRLLNSQTGAYEDVSVTLEGRDEVPVAGTLVEALRYRLSVKAGDITLWYSADDQTWLGLEAPAKGGRKLLYQAVSIPQALPQMAATRT